MIHSIKGEKMQKFINTFLKIIKYPFGLACLCFAYPLMTGLMHLIFKTFNMNIFLYFLLPIFAMMFIWSMIPSLRGHWLTIFAHEFTHMLAAIITFHKPAGMSIKQDVGGSFSYKGKGNWLITLAPYFFPTFPFLWMLGGLWFQWNHQAVPQWYILTFGGLVGYHIVANFYQIHDQQTDFKKAGFLFSFMIIPALNFIMIGYLWCFVLHGWSGLGIWNKIAFQECNLFFQQMLNKLL